MIMKPYGYKPKNNWCDCIYCHGKNYKTKKAARQKGKKEIRNELQRLKPRRKDQGR